MALTFWPAILLTAVALGGCAGNGTTTTQTPWTGPPPSGPCASLYDESLGSQVLAHTAFSDQGAEHAVPNAELIRYHGPDPEHLQKAPVFDDCVRLTLPSEGEYMVFERTPNNVSGGENCYWYGGATFVHDGKPYYEVTVHMNFQCAHA